MDNVKTLFNILLSDKPSELIKYHEKEIFLLIPELEKSKDLIKIMNGTFMMFMNIFFM